MSRSKGRTPQDGLPVVSRRGGPGARTWAPGRACLVDVGPAARRKDRAVAIKGGEGPLGARISTSLGPRPSPPLIAIVRSFLRPKLATRAEKAGHRRREARCRSRYPTSSPSFVFPLPTGIRGRLARPSARFPPRSARPSASSGPFGPGQPLRTGSVRARRRDAVVSTYVRSSRLSSPRIAAGRGALQRRAGGVRCRPRPRGTVRALEPRGAVGAVPRGSCAFRIRLACARPRGRSSPGRPRGRRRRRGCRRSRPPPSRAGSSSAIAAPPARSPARAPELARPGRPGSPARSCRGACAGRSRRPARAGQSGGRTRRRSWPGCGESARPRHAGSSGVGGAPPAPRYEGHRTPPVRVIFGASGLPGGCSVRVNV